MPRMGLVAAHTAGQRVAVEMSLVFDQVLMTGETTYKIGDGLHVRLMTFGTCKGHRAVLREGLVLDLHPLMTA